MDHLINERTPGLYDIAILGTEEDAAFALGVLLSLKHCDGFSVEKIIIDRKRKAIIRLTAWKTKAIEILRELYETDAIDCEHEITSLEGVDDDIRMGSDGEIHQHSHPDIERCKICGKFYNTATESWEKD